MFEIYPRWKEDWKLVAMIWHHSSPLSSSPRWKEDWKKDVGSDYTSSVWHTKLDEKRIERFISGEPEVDSLLWQLDEKRIERWFWNSLYLYIHVSSRWKEDWKTIVILRFWDNFVEIARWKEDWKTIYAYQTFYKFIYNSMKRGLKVCNLTIALAFLIEFVLDEKRIERGRLGRANLRVVCSLDEKRIER